MLLIAVASAALGDDAGLNAAPGYAPPPFAGVTDVPLALILNGEPRGDVFAKLTSDGDVLLPAAALRDMGVAQVDGTEYALGGETFVSLRSIHGARFELNENTLVLALMLPPEAFGLQERSFASQRVPRGVRTEETSAFVNYRLGHTAGDVEASSLLATEAALRARGFLLRNEALQTHSGSQWQSVRFQTQLVHDDRDTAHRWIVGDWFASSGDVGSTLNLGGLTYAKAYEITPYVVRQPTVTFAGAATTPSDVEVFVGDARVYQGRLSPGAFELRDFGYYGGRQDVRILVRDALGQEQILAYPFYFSDQVLGAGLHEFSYSAGLLRENYGVESGQYGEFAASAFHRYGWSDGLTLALRGEYSDRRGNLGPLAALRFDRLGTLSLGASASRDEASDSNGVAGAVAYLYREDAFTARAGHREFSADYAVADPLAGAQLLRHESLAGAGYGTPWSGHFDLQYLDSRFRGAAGIRSVALNYSRAVGRNTGVFAVVRHIVSEPSSTEAFCGFSVTLGPYQNVSAYYTRTETSDTEVIQTGNSLGPREGFGYRASLEREARGDVETTRFAPYGEFGGRYATLIAENRTEQTGDETSSVSSVAVQGALRVLGGSAGLSRRIDDSFAEVEVMPPVEGVRVYHNSQEIGRTDGDGALVIPGMASFLDNAVSLQDQDLPLEYSLRQSTQTLSPPYRSGSIVRFEVRRSAGVFGRLVRRTPGGTEPLEYHEAHLRIDGRDQVFPTGADGEFYLEDLAQGRYAGGVSVDGQVCEFALAVPEITGPMAEIEEPLVCHVAP